MRNFFNIDSFFWRGLCRLADLMLLNLLFVLCCLPLFTIGPSLSALYTVCLKMADNEDVSIVKSFSQAFRRNFRQSTLLWIIMAGCAAVLGLNWFFLPVLPEAPAEVMKVLLNLMLLVYIAVFSYLFPIQCKFENSIKNTLKNAFALAFRHLIPCTLPVCALNLAPVMLLKSGSTAGIWILTISLWFWFSGIAFINSKLFLRVFRSYISSGPQASNF